MEISTHCKATLELGKKLTKELGLDQSNDTLGRWMAHYIAELIQDAEQASPKERSVKMKTCCDEILNLWKHRCTLPSGKRPFEELEPLLRTIESLDPEDDEPRYFYSVRTSINKVEKKDDINTWLNLVDGLDYSAKLLIRYCLAQAAQNVIDKSEEWIVLAKEAGADEGIEFSLIDMICNEDSDFEEADSGVHEKKRIECRIERLEKFAEFALAVASDLRKQIEGTRGTD